MKEYIAEKGGCPIVGCSLLCGHEGNRKSDLCAAVCDSLGLHFYSVCCASLVENTEASTSERICQALERAESSLPCVCCLEGIDALEWSSLQAAEKNRLFTFFFKTNQSGCSQCCCCSAFKFAEMFQEWKQSVEKRLLDGGNNVLFVVATTKDKSELSPLFQVLFPRHIAVPNLTDDERRAVLGDLFSPIDTSPDFVIDELIPKTSAFSVDDLETLIHLAEDEAVKCGTESPVTMSNCVSALARMQRHQGVTIGRPNVPNVKWEDIGGLESVKEQIMDTCWLPLAHKNMFPDGVVQSAGILLYGPPGTGKTLVAKAVATELSMNFLSVKGPELLSMYIGESEKNVRTVFETARNAAPCVIFFDELDSLAPKRGAGADSAGVMDRVVSQMLAELDGRRDGRTIFVIGATNRPDLLEPALMSPGRFDHLLYLGLSNTVETKLQILQSITRTLTLSDNVDLKEVATLCPEGLSGADMSAVCSGAYLSAMERVVEKHVGQKDEKSDGSDLSIIITQNDFLDSLANVQPSVSPQEMERYEALHRQFSRN